MASVGYFFLSVGQLESAVDAGIVRIRDQIATQSKIVYLRWLERAGQRLGISATAGSVR